MLTQKWLIFTFGCFTQRFFFFGNGFSVLLLPHYYRSGFLLLFSFTVLSRESFWVSRKKGSRARRVFVYECFTLKEISWECASLPSDLFISFLFPFPPSTHLCRCSRTNQICELFFSTPCERLLNKGDSSFSPVLSLALNWLQPTIRVALGSFTYKLSC